MTRDTLHHIDLVLDTDWLARLRTAGGDSSSSYLARLLTKAQRYELPETAHRSWPDLLSELWRQPLEGWASAVFALSAEGAPFNASARAEPALWWRADPVHLVPGLDHVRLAAAGSALMLDRTDAGALVAELQAHLREWDMELIAPCPTRWYLRADRPMVAAAVASAFAAGRDLRHLLARGPDATVLLRLATECQMLLAESQVNESRTQRGFPTVNSLWLWGGGKAPGAKPVPWAAGLPLLVSNDPELRGAWHHARGESLSGQEGGASPATRRLELLQAATGEDLLAVLDRDALEAGEALADTVAWLDELLGALVAQRSTQVRLIAGATAWQLPRGLRAHRWWPFERRASNLAELFDGSGRAGAHPWYSRGLRRNAP